MRWMAALLLTGCTPVGAWFDGMEEVTGSPSDPGPAPVGARVYGADAWVLLAGPVGGHVELESSDPSVVAIEPAPEDLADEGQQVVLLRTGGAGSAVLSAWDCGDLVGAVEVEVAEPATTTLVANGDLFDALDRIPARQLEGTRYTWAVEHLDDLGRSLAGFAVPPEDLLDPDQDPLLPYALGAGHERVTVEVTTESQGLDPELAAWVGEAAVEGVDPDDVVALELWPSAAPDGGSALIAVGLDRDGEPVLGLPATWSEPGTGDAYRFVEDPLLPLREVVVEWNGLEASAWVRGAPGAVTSSDSRGCATAPAGGCAATAALALLVRRRR